MIRKWEPLRKRIACDLFHRVMSPDADAGVAALLASVFGRGEGEPWKKTWFSRLEELANEARDRVMKWDVRLAGRLLELFPEYIPKKYQGKSLTADLVTTRSGDECEWVLVW